MNYPNKTAGLNEAVVILGIILFGVISCVVAKKLINDYDKKLRKAAVEEVTKLIETRSITPSEKLYSLMGQSQELTEIVEQTIIRNRIYEIYLNPDTGELAQTIVMRGITAQTPNDLQSKLRVLTKILEKLEEDPTTSDISISEATPTEITLQLSRLENILSREVPVTLGEVTLLREAISKLKQSPKPYAQEAGKLLSQLN